MPCKAIVAWHGAQIERTSPGSPWFFKCVQGSHDGVLTGLAPPRPHKESF
jgi:hypothetical protein